MYILFDSNTREVIATIGAKDGKDIVKNPYVLIDLGDKEPIFQEVDRKIIFTGFMRGNIDVK